MKKVAILGSTGSIGTQALEVIADHAEDFEVTALSCGRNIERLAQQVRSFHPKLVSVEKGKDAKKLKDLLTSDPDAGRLPEIHSGMEGLCAVATEESAQILLTAVVGMIGIRPTIEAIRAGKDIALANKETLVCAGHIIMPLARERGCSILPVDSEHSAIFQSLRGNEMNRVRKILLTCSGGPFRGKKRADLEEVGVRDALKHPNWSMGKKITIDSASLVNKGLEVMEAGWLFGLEADQIQVLVHPQSILHSAVEYEDGAVIGQMGLPDMKLPIQYALYYPCRHRMRGNKLDLFSTGALTFERPDTETFRGLPLACEAVRRGGNVPTVFNAANERAVSLFLAGKIRFLDIYELIARTMEGIDFVADPGLEEILMAEQASCDYIDGIMDK